MPSFLCRSLLIALLLVQAVASLGRGEAICIPLDCCLGPALEPGVMPHCHHHGPAAGRSFVVHRHGLGESRAAVERVHHACGHDHRGHGHGEHGRRPHRFHHDACGSDAECGRDDGCGDHLHLDLIDHDLPPRGGSCLDLLVAAAVLPGPVAALAVRPAASPPAVVAASEAWIASDQRRVIDAASIVV